MADKNSRSYNMSRIKSKNTTIELLLRRELWKRGFRYRVNDKTIFGKPDMVFRKQKLSINTKSGSVSFTKYSKMKAK